MKRDVFFAAVRLTVYGGKLSQSQVNGLTTLLDYFDHRQITGRIDPRFLAYMLATTNHETDSKMEPIEEYGKGAGKPYQKGGYWGRGYPQLTWQANYADWEKRLGVPLLAHPELVLTPAVALPILYDGMILGTFTGKKLGDYFTGIADDPTNARRIINGTDQAAKIAGYHRSFLTALLAATA